MFEQDFFNQDKPAGPGRGGQAMGALGGWGLHLAKVAFLLYSGYHGISASWTYAGNSDLARVAQTVGIVALEVVLFSLYLAWHNQRITGTEQSIAAGVTYGVGFALACLGIVADSQLHAGIALSGALGWYLRHGLPLAPAVMALGAVLTHMLAPGQLRARREAAERVEFEQEQFDAHMAAQRAEMEAAKLVKNFQLNARMGAARQIAQWYSSDQAQRAIAQTALHNAPALLRAAGVNVADLPDLPDLADRPTTSSVRTAPHPEPVTQSSNGRGPDVGANFPYRANSSPDT